MSVEEIVAAALLNESKLHAEERFSELGDRYDDVHGEILPLMEEPNVTVGLAFNFWDCWVDAANHDWRYHEGIGRDDWPKLATEIAGALRQGVEVTDPVLVERFSPRPRRSFRRWVSDLFKGPEPQ